MVKIVIVVRVVTIALNLVLRLIRGIDRAVRPSMEQYQKAAGAYTWTHQKYGPSSLYTAGRSDRGISINRAALEDVAASYLGYAELRTDYLDWLLIDALLFAELDRFVEQTMKGGYFFPINWARLFADRDLLRHVLLRPLVALVEFVLRYLLLPAIAVHLLATGRETAAKWVGGVFIVYLLYRLVTGIPAQIERQRLRRKRTELIWEMHAVYMLAEPPVISPTRLKAAIDDATTKGAVFPAAALSLVHRLADINPDVCRPMSEQARPSSRM